MKSHRVAGFSASSNDIADIIARYRASGLGLKAFALKDKKLKKIAEIVHDLDMKDDKYSSAEAKGLENILAGIRNSSTNDSETLEKGMAIFAMLYAALT